MHWVFGIFHELLSSSQLRSASVPRSPSQTPLGWSLSEAFWLPEAPPRPFESSWVQLFKWSCCSFWPRFRPQREAAGVRGLFLVFCGYSLITTNCVAQLIKYREPPSHSGSTCSGARDVSSLSKNNPWYSIWWWSPPCGVGQTPGDDVWRSEMTFLIV